MANALGIEGNTLRIRGNAVCIGCCGGPVLQVSDWLWQAATCTNTGVQDGATFLTQSPPGFGQSYVQAALLNVEASAEYAGRNSDAGAGRTRYTFSGTALIGKFICLWTNSPNTNAATSPTPNQLRSFLQTFRPGFISPATVIDSSLGVRTPLYGSNVPDIFVRAARTPEWFLSSSNARYVTRDFIAYYGSESFTVLEPTTNPLVFSPPIAVPFGQPRLDGAFNSLNSPVSTHFLTRSFGPSLPPACPTFPFPERPRFAGDLLLNNTLFVASASPSTRPFGENYTGSISVSINTEFPYQWSEPPQAPGVIGLPPPSSFGRSALPPTDPRIAALSPENNTCRGCGDG